MISRKHISPIYGSVFLLSILLFLTACSHSPEIKPEPLTGFSEKVTALVTATVRGQLRDSPQRQQILRVQLPSFEKTVTLNQLTEELKGIEPLKDLAYLIETDVMFEIQKPEHQREKMNFHTPEIQREVVSAILAGMNKALVQLKGGKNGR